MSTHVTFYGKTTFFRNEPVEGTFELAKELGAEPWNGNKQRGFKGAARVAVKTAGTQFEGANKRGYVLVTVLREKEGYRLHSAAPAKGPARDAKGRFVKRS